MAGLFQVLWGEADETFKVAEVLTGSDGQPLIIPEGDDVEVGGGVSLENICTRPVAVDWDGDGDLDLVVGNFGGSFYLFLGEGAGVFQSAARSIKSGEALLRITGHHSDPFVVDWDGDGDLDLLSGSSEGGVQWAENRAGEGRLPELNSFEALIPTSGPIDYAQLRKEDDLVGPMSSTRIWVEDVNGDGKLDILVGDMIYLTSPAEGMTERTFKVRHAAWVKEQAEARAEYTELMTQAEDDVDVAGHTDQSALGTWLGSLFGTAAPKSKREQALQRINDLYQQQSQFMKREMTGFVWLYLQE